MKKKLFITLSVFILCCSAYAADQQEKPLTQSAILFMSNTWTEVQTFLRGIVVGGTGGIVFSDNGTITTDEDYISYEKGVIYPPVDITVVGDFTEVQLLPEYHIVFFFGSDTLPLAKMPVPVRGQPFLFINQNSSTLIVNPNDAETFDGESNLPILSGKFVLIMFDGTEWKKQYASEVIPVGPRILASSSAINDSWENIFATGDSDNMTLPQDPEDGQKHTLKSLGTGNLLLDGAADKLIDGNASIAFAENDAITVMWVEGLDTWNIQSYFVDIP